MPPSRSYTPMRRPGARVAWPPDDSWSVSDLVAVTTFWRNYGALREFSGDKRCPPPVSVPAQRTRPHQERIDNLTHAAFGTNRNPPRNRTPSPHQIPSTPYSGGTR